MEGEDLDLGLVVGSAAMHQQQRDLALEGVGPVSSVETGGGACSWSLYIAGLTHSNTLKIGKMKSEGKIL